jgi:hypothetical protein
VYLVMVTSFLRFFNIFKGSTGRTAQIALELRRVADEQLNTTTGEFKEGFSLPPNFYVVQLHSVVHGWTLLQCWYGLQKYGSHGL